MICPFPGCRLVGLRLNLDPLLGLPIEYADGIEPLLVRSASAKDDDSIIISIVAHGAVGAMGGDIACGVYFLPLHGDGVEGPQVVHVVGVWVIDDVPAYPPK